MWSSGHAQWIEGEGERNFKDELNGWVGGGTKKKTEVLLILTSGFDWALELSHGYFCRQLDAWF